MVGTQNCFRLDQNSSTNYCNEQVDKDDAYVHIACVYMYVCIKELTYNSLKYLKMILIVF